MRCPYCGFSESKVIDSRPTEDNIRRRRECMSCGKRFTTYESVERMPIVVVKKDGSRQAFDRVKIINSMLHACEKRTVGLPEIEAVAIEIEQEAQNYPDREIPSSYIGELVMRHLKQMAEEGVVDHLQTLRVVLRLQKFEGDLFPRRPR